MTMQSGRKHSLHTGRKHFQQVTRKHQKGADGLFHEAEAAGSRSGMIGPKD